jgi:hypothetical protein
MRVFVALLDLLSALRTVLLSLVLGGGALLVLAVGIFGAAWVGVEVRRAFGPAYELWAFGGAVGTLIAIAAGLYRWQAATLGWLAPFGGRRAPEVQYCQTCGAATRLDAVVCSRCAGTRFGIAQRGIAGGAGGAAAASTGGVGVARVVGGGTRWSYRSRWHLQVGMDVLDEHGVAVGVVKRKRTGDFLVARPRRRDVYVPLPAIARAEGATVHLTLPATALEAQPWTRPALLGLLALLGRRARPRGH